MKIQHPSIKDCLLNFESIIGPENILFFRGKISNSNEINLPNYWKGLIDEKSISVHLSPIGSHQNVIVKRVSDNKVYLQSHGGMPIDCYYFIMGERKDVPKLEVVEVLDKDPKV